MNRQIKEVLHEVNLAAKIMVKNRTWWAEDYERDDDEEEEPDLDVEVDKSNIDITQRDAETNAKQQRLHPTLPPNTSA